MGSVGRCSTVDLERTGEWKDDDDNDYFRGEVRIRPALKLTHEANTARVVRNIKRGTKKH